MSDKCPNCGANGSMFGGLFFHSLAADSVSCVTISDFRRRLAEAEARSVRLEMELRNCTASLHDRLAENGGLAIRLIDKEKAAAELVEALRECSYCVAEVAKHRQICELIAKHGGAL